MDKLTITGQNLNTSILSEVSNNFDIEVEISDESQHRIKYCRIGLEKLLKSDRVIYGINTGFGSLSEIKIEATKLEALQKNLIRSHTAGTGEILPVELVRGAMILRLNTLCLGHSGVRIEVANLICDMLNNDIYPQIPKFGSVGASGDLALLSAMALAMIEDERSEFQPMVDIKTSDGMWSEMRSGEALKLKGLKPIKLQAKEGLALNNGCQVSNSVAGYALDIINKAFTTSILAFGLSLQAINGNTSAYDNRVHAVRPHSGQSEIADIIGKVISGSRFLDTENTRVQDAYSFRCFPQVAGSALDILKLSNSILTTEMNSATDNPLLFEGDGDTLDSISGGNFHGAPIAHAADIAMIATVDLASISERRTFRLITNKFSGLPSFLTNDPGLSSGLMIAQYTAANLVSHSKSMCFPGSVDTIPTCEGQEDHVSMAPVSAFKLLEVAEIFVSVVAIELLTACQAVEIRATKDNINENKALSELTRNAYLAVRDSVPFIAYDEPISPHIKSIEEMILDGEFNFLTPLL